MVVDYLLLEDDGEMGYFEINLLMFSVGKEVAMYFYTFSHPVVDGRNV